MTAIIIRLERVTPQVEELGLRLHSVAVRDLMLPTDLKKAYAAVLKARKEGLAILERARGETAALRNLANAARMMEEHPMLLQLRWMQNLSQSPGSTVVVGSTGPVVPVPRRGGAAEETDAPDEET